ncbi:MAG: thioesterase [Defluviitaleaceae bacterium]|nr:thioesterase [Defluviitaleaceae bacterium]
MNTLYQQPIRITYYDLDYRGKIKLSALLRMVHVAADVNASQLGAGYDVLAPLGMTFVLQRFGVSIIRMPVYNEDVFIRTWPSDVAKGTFLRRGDMYDSTGNKIMEWSSLWLLFDIAARKVLRPTALPTPLSSLGSEGVEVQPEKLTHPGDWGIPHSQFSHTVTYRDADTNMHMNNSVYGDLIGNAIFTTTDSIPDWKQVQINYLAELPLGGNVEVEARRDSDSFIVIGNANGRTAFIAKIN